MSALVGSASRIERNSASPYLLQGFGKGVVKTHCDRCGDLEGNQQKCQSDVLLGAVIGNRALSVSLNVLLVAPPS